MLAKVKSNKFEKNVDRKQKNKICNLEKGKGDRKKTIHEK